jgi:KUP system potassium uptake protein
MSDVLAGGHHFDTKKLSFIGILVSLGVVFGDIGTSPLYVMSAIIKSGKEAQMISEEYIEGALSCIIWTLTLQTTIKYVLISLRADNKGEGGILALFSLVKKMRMKWLYLIAIIGASALIADGVITPSLTVMASIEGLKQIDGLELGINPILGITTVILVFIFVVQQFGTSFIGKFFGPVMVIWFLFLGIMGVINLQYHPEILKSFNPYYAFKLIVNSPNALWILGAVFLCTTGAEALYSDLGHCGAKNIRVSWFFVKIMLILNYLGQGSWLLENYNMVFTGTNPFFGMLPQFLIIRPGQFPSGFGTQSRQWFVNKLPSNFAMVQRLEAGMNAKRITLSSEDKIRYQKMLRDGRD